MKRRYLYLLLGTLFFVSCKDDDSSAGSILVPGEACFSDTLFNEMETVGNIKVGIHLSLPAPADYTLEVAAALENNMTEGKDYILASTRIPVKKGESLVYAEIELIDNRSVDPTRYIDLRIIEAGGGGVVEPSRCRIYIIDDESQCAVVFLNREKRCYESNETVCLPIYLEGTPSGKTVRFSVKQVGGTAIEGRDYELLSATDFEFSAKTDTAKLIIRTINNNYNSEDLVLIWEITEVQGAQKLTTRSNSLMIIKDDDTGLSFGKAQVTVAETENLLLLPIRLTQALSEDVEVKVKLQEGGTALEGSDFTLEKSVVIPAGQDSVMLAFKPKYSSTVNDDRTVALAIEMCSNSKISIDGGTCEVTIWDCDTKLLFAAPAYDVLSTDKKYVVAVSLEKALAHNVSFTVESANAKIFTPETETLMIPAGQLKANITLNVIAPVLQKRSEIALRLKDVLGATAGVQTSLSMTFRLNKGAWAVAYVSSEEAVQDGPATARKLIDNEESTFWHNQWAGVPAMEIPCEAIIDLNSDYVLTWLELVRRVNNADTKRVEVYTTEAEDWKKATWILQKTLVFSTNTAERRQTINWTDNYPTAHYVKVKIVQGSGSNAASLAELTLHGWLK
ncbi:MAG: discoidin domain-containing protein [Odoribacter sp.]